MKCVSGPIVAAALAAGALCLAGCGAQGGVPDHKAEAPPPVQVEKESDANLVKIEHPEQFPVTVALEHRASPELNVTGVVSADVSRTVPVISLASGRVVDIRARLGDSVTKGQLLMRVQSSDLGAAFADYRRALADQTLSRAQYDRAKLLYDKGAVAQKDLEVALDASEKAKVDVETALEKLKVLGADIDHPSPIIDILSPATGVITEQNVTAASGVKTLDNSPNLFTIADLSNVWVICDVYENDLPKIHLNETATVRLNAYPDRALTARISNIAPTLDPAIRTAKVRLELPNPGLMRLGMFVTATFKGAAQEAHAVVPASAILHLHDRDWVYMPSEGNTFRRVEVAGGKMIPPNLQEVVSGIRPGDKVVTSALVLQNTAEQ